MGRAATRRCSPEEDVPAPLRPGDNLDPARPMHGSVIAMVKHMVISIANPPATLTNPFTARYVGTEQRLLKAV